MRRRMLCALLVTVAAPSILLAKEALPMSTQSGDLTLDWAVAAIRSKSPRSGTTFHVLRELRSSVETRGLADRSFQEARSHHVELYGNGIYLDVLRSGGFLILEDDPGKDRAIAIHLVSAGPSREPVIDSHEIQGNVKPGDATELISNNAHFVENLLRMSSASALSLETRFLGGHFPEYVDPSNEGFFEVPSSLAKITADQNGNQELAALSGSFHLWPIRYAMSLTIYPANPSNAVRTARTKYEALLREFERRNNRSSDFTYDLVDLESIQSAEQLRERITMFKQANDFLERTFKPEDRSPNAEINSSISTIGSQLGSIDAQTGRDSLFLVVTSPGLIVAWMRPNTGSWAVTRISLAEDGEDLNGEAESRIRPRDRRNNN